MVPSPSQQPWSQTVPEVMPWNVPSGWNGQPWLKEAAESFNADGSSTKIKRPYDEKSHDDFDFDCDRPKKKFISEDKILEIFADMHIREGEQCVVKDVSESDSDSLTIEDENGFLIKKLDDSEPLKPGGQTFEWSEELVDALKAAPKTAFEKIIEDQKVKFSKAVVLWQPSISFPECLSKTLPNETSGEDNDEDFDDGTVVLEEMQLDS